MSKLSIKGILEELDKLSKSNQLRCMTNPSKSFSGIVWIDKLCIILLKKIVSMFNKEEGKRQFLTLHGNGCKKRKNGS